MTTSIYIDDDIKQKATQLARKNRLSFSAVVRILLSDYSEGRIVIGARSISQSLPRYDHTEEIAVDQETQTKMDDVVTLWRNKKRQ